MSKKILVIAAHADDEIIGCGGTLAKHSASGDKVEIVFVADGVTSRKTVNSDDKKKREHAAQKAAQIIGAQSIQFLDYPDNQLDTVPILEIVKDLERVITQYCPNVIYTHHSGDLNIDHRITFNASLTAARPLPGSLVHEIYTFETMSSTEWNAPSHNPFMPSLFHDISDFLDVKFGALDCYEMEMHPSPHSRSKEHLRALAIHRGNTVGIGAAEAFMPIRLIAK